jgi:chorismate dehydratase
MWDFLHPPLQSSLAERYDLHFTQPSQCARELLAFEADLGLIPIAALTPELLIVPGCTIASLRQVRSIQLIVKHPLALHEVKTVAADTASRSSVAYAEVLLRHFFGAHPGFEPAPADPVAMLLEHDAALLIGDPALLALEKRTRIEAAVGPCTWHDVATLWREKTALPWVAAVWALRSEVTMSQREREQLFVDLNSSRRHGQQHIEDLVREWTPRIALPPAIIRTYLTENIHYLLDDECKATIVEFRRLAARYGILPSLDVLPILSVA